MKIDIEPTLEGFTSRLRVRVGDAKELTSVVVSLDGVVIATDVLADHHIAYERLFPRVGHASPGARHALVVTVTEGKETYSASRFWEDPT